MNLSDLLVLKDVLKESSPTWLIIALVFLFLLKPFQFVVKYGRALLKKNHGVLWKWLIPFGKMSFDNADRFICFKNPLKLTSSESEDLLEHYKYVMIEKNLGLFGKKPPSKWSDKIQDQKSFFPSTEEQKINCLVDVKQKVYYQDVSVKRKELISFISTLSKKGYE